MNPDISCCMCHRRVYLSTDAETGEKVLNRGNVILSADKDQLSANTLIGESVVYFIQSSIPFSR
jgi:hypothetical protein